jgi:hypothetical protein
MRTPLARHNAPPHGSQALYVAAKLGIADVLGDGVRSSDELAEATHTHSATLRRLLRMLATLASWRKTAQAVSARPRPARYSVGTCRDRSGLSRYS